MQRGVDGGDGVDWHVQPSLDDGPHRSRAYLQACAGLNVTLGVGNVGGGYRSWRTLRCTCVVGPEPRTIQSPYGRRAKHTAAKSKEMSGNNLTSPIVGNY